MFTAVTIKICEVHFHIVGSKHAQGGLDEKDSEPLDLE